MNGDDKLVRTSEAAQLLSVSEWSIRKMAKEGELPYIQRGSRSSPMLFDPEDLREWVEKHKTRKMGA